MQFICNNEVEPVAHWMRDLQRNKAYREPILKKSVVNVIHLICETLEQDIHVFVLAVNLLEKCLTAEVEDAMLVILVVVFMCSKIVGEQFELKSRHVVALYKQMTTIRIDASFIKCMEIRLLEEFQQNIPISSEVDDLKVLYTVYVKPLNLKKSLLNLAIQILELIYLNNYDFFFALKRNYERIHMLNVFTHIVSTKLYLICGIILASFTLTKYQNCFDVDRIMSDFSAMSSIHKDHYEILTKGIVGLVQKSTK